MEYVVVTWPDSQLLMDKKGFRNHCELINSEKGLELYGSSAYLVDKKWLSDVKQGLIQNDMDDDMNELIINNDFF